MSTPAPLPEQLRRSFAPGTALRNRTKQIPQNAKKVAFMIMSVATIFWFAIYGLPAVKSWWNKPATQERNVVRDEVERKRAAPPRAEGMVGEPAGKPTQGGVQQDYKVKLAKGERTKPVRVMFHECIRWWSENPDANDFVVLVRGVDDTTWYTWEAYQGFKKAGKIPFDSPGWYAFEGVRDGVEAFYHVGQRDQCG